MSHVPSTPSTPNKKASDCVNCFRIKGILDTLDLRVGVRIPVGQLNLRVF